MERERRKEEEVEEEKKKTKFVTKEKSFKKIQTVYNKVSHFYSKNTHYALCMLVQWHVLMGEGPAP